MKINPFMRHFAVGNKYLQTAIIISFSISVSGCLNKIDDKSSDPLLTETVALSPILGYTLPSGDIPANASQSELADWAWQQFVALGWQSTYDPTSSGAERGVPDTTWQISDNTSPTHTVWETFAHRQELRPYKTDLTLDYDELHIPNYKIGATLNPADPNNTSFTLLNNLDEDNEIGSALIYLGVPENTSTANLVLYQAKVNRDEYNYIKNTFPDQADDMGTLAKAASNNKANIKTYKTAILDQNNEPIADNCNIPDGVASNKYIVLPCGNATQAGAIEIKTAFMKVDEDQIVAGGPFEDFLIRDAIYYTKNGDGSFTYHNGKFALLGIHIIRKTENFPGFIFTSFEHNSLENGITTNVDGQDEIQFFHFQNLTPVDPDYGKFANQYSEDAAGKSNGKAYGGFVKIERQTGPNPTSNGKLYPIPKTIKSVTSTYQAALGEVGSVWANYKLSGVQAQPVDYIDRASDPNYFMANFIIESDSFLGNFYGPGFSSQKPAFPSQPTHVFPDGSQNGDNVIANLQSFNMGGCKGCHGVAATAFGTDTSFLLDFGKGKPVTEPDTINFVD